MHGTTKLKFRNLFLLTVRKFIHSFIHFIFHISIYRLNTKDVEIVVVVVTISGKVTGVRCFNTIIIQWSHSN